MTDILNLDDYAKVLKTVKINGAEYPVVEMTVETFIAATKESAKYEAETKQDDAVAHIESAVRMLAYAIPSFPEVEIRKLNFSQIKVLIAFVRGELEKATPSEVEQGNVVQE